MTRSSLFFYWSLALGITTIVLAGELSWTLQMRCAVRRRDYISSNRRNPLRVS
jgi:hypothetical protein